MIVQFLSWYLVVQLITLATLPVAGTLFANLGDRGYAFAKSLGILLVGFVLWLGTSYGLLRNETGGAWLALLIVGVIGVAVGQGAGGKGQGTRDEDTQHATRNTYHVSRINPRYILFIELLFLLAFASWAYVRAYDPAANHTEKPMDLMFMNSIWVSPTYPPQDAWLSGYAISYYYFGYWLLTTVARLAGQPPEIAFSVGQACWFGLLLIGCVGIVYNLLRHEARSPRMALLGGLLAAVAVGIAGNLQGSLEWLYANGVNINGLAHWFAVNGFPENAAQSGNWYIGFDWWWWRSSRVLQDLDLMGQHIEVIDEFPFFSYILGDNHPHVLAMPFVLLVIALAQNLFFGRLSLKRNHHPGAFLGMEDTVRSMPSPPPAALGITAQSGAAPLFSAAQVRAVGREAIQLAQIVIPLGWAGFVLIVIAAGSLVFLNTWDFPPYWLLLMAGLFAVLLRLGRSGVGKVTAGRAVLFTAIFGVALVVAIVVLYLPYFLTAQSQAGGFVPNLFNPTRFPQFFLMFGSALFGVMALLSLAFNPTLSAKKPESEGWGDPSRKILLSLAVVYGIPLLFLLFSIVLAMNTEAGRDVLTRMTLPPDATSYWPFIVRRWGTQGFTFLVTGGLLALTLAAIWQRLEADNEDESDLHAKQAMTFALFLAAIGLLLVYVPEFVYLRDNFGTRMNTIFKFYYQAWLLFGLSTGYAVVTAFVKRGEWGKEQGAGGEERGANTQHATRNTQHVSRIFAVLAFLLIIVGLIYPVTATYSKTGGFAAPTPTFDATAYVALENPAEMAAIQWIRTNTAPDAVIVEGKGASYRANYSRISAATGRPTLLGWDGHESQWRGVAYGRMAQGRAEALKLIYRNGTPEQIAQTLATWQIDYVYVGPTERGEYQMTPLSEERLSRAMDLVFEQDEVRIYQRRSN